MVLGLVELFLILILVVPWLWVVYDAAKWPGAVWQGAGRSKVVWLGFIVALAPFGVLAYLILTRPELVAASLVPHGAGSPAGAGPRAGEENPLLLMRRNTVVAIILLLAAIAIAGVLGVLRLWQLT